jgi:hypothetical protein
MMTVFTTGDRRNLTMAVKVDGVTRWVKFTFPVIYGNRGESTFATCEEDLIEAMKKRPEFGSVYYIKEEPKETKAVSEASEVKTIEDELGDAENAIIVESVTTKGMAIAYIQGMYGESFTATTVEDMKREAAQKWKTLFPKWGK